LSGPHRGSNLRQNCEFKDRNPNDISEDSGVDACKAVDSGSDESDTEFDGLAKVESADSTACGVSVDQ
jgi:hypothetical protein